MKNKFLVFLNVILIFIIIVIMQYKGLTNYYYVNNDMRQYFFINNFRENIDDNLLAQYSFAKWPSMTIYLSLFYVFVNTFIDFLMISKIISILLFLFSVIFMYKLGSIIKNKRYSSILAFLFILYSWTIASFQLGLSRSFAFPLLIAFLYYFIKKDILKLSIILLLEAMLYPPVFLISLFTFGFSLIDLKDKRIRFDINRNRLFFIFAALAVISILAPMLFINYGIKERITFKEAILSPEFYDGGRFLVFRGPIPFTSDFDSIIHTLTNLYNPRIYRPFHQNGVFILYLTSFIFMVAYRKKIFKLPKEIYFLLISSLVLQSLAFLLLFKLHMPVRYVHFSIPLVLMVIFANGMYFLSEKKKTKPFFAVMLLLLIIFYIPKVNPVLMHCEDADIYEYIKTLPKESLIAGHPNDMDCIALYGQRKPFIMSELNQPFYTDYYKIIKQRNYDFFSAYYSSSKNAVKEFCNKNEITHLVVNKWHFDQEFLTRDRIYLEPFNAFIKNITKGRNDFYLVEPENELYESNNKAIVGCGS